MSSSCYFQARSSLRTNASRRHLRVGFLFSLRRGFVSSVRELGAIPGARWWRKLVRGGQKSGGLQRFPWCLCLTTLLWFVNLRMSFQKVSLSSRVWGLIMIVKLKALSCSYWLPSCWASNVIYIFFIAQSGCFYPQEWKAEVLQALGVCCQKSRRYNECVCVGSRVKTSQIMLLRWAISLFENSPKAAASTTDHSGPLARPGSQI